MKSISMGVVVIHKCPTSFTFYWGGGGGVPISPLD